jgi:hypothetical protein
MALAVVAFVGVSSAVTTPIRTTHLAFVFDGQSIQRPGGLRVQITPSKTPAAAGYIYWASRLRLPVRVTVPSGEGDVNFPVRAADDGGLWIPCSSPHECCRILVALRHPCDVPSTVSTTGTSMGGR